MGAYTSYTSKHSLRCTALQDEIKAALAMNSRYHSSAAYQDALDSVLSALVDPGKVAWAPEFGVALVATESHVPFHQTILQAVCLDNWSEESHRYSDSMVHANGPDVICHRKLPVLAKPGGGTSIELHEIHASLQLYVFLCLAAAIQRSRRLLCLWAPIHSMPSVARHFQGSVC